jgi:hypothetical protein
LPVGKAADVRFDYLLTIAVAIMDGIPGPDVSIAKVNAADTGLAYVGYIGETGIEIGLGIAVDSAGNAYVTGWNSSAEASFLVVVGPNLTFNGALRMYS